MNYAIPTLLAVLLVPWAGGQEVDDYDCFPGGRLLAELGRAGRLGPSVVEEHAGCPTGEVPGARDLPEQADARALAAAVFQYPGSPGYVVSSSVSTDNGIWVQSPGPGKPELMTRRVTLPDEPMQSGTMVIHLLHQVEDEAGIFVPFLQPIVGEGAVVEPGTLSGETLGEVFLQLAAIHNANLRIQVTPMPEGLKYPHRVEIRFDTLLSHGDFPVEHVNGYVPGR